MGKLIPLPGLRPEGRAHWASDALADGASSDYYLLPIAGLLFIFSLARVAYALWRQEPFQPEPTVALGCVVGLPWLAWRLVRKA